VGYLVGDVVEGLREGSRVIGAFVGESVGYFVGDIVCGL